jgi:phage terminase large subunit-like protein
MTKKPTRADAVIDFIERLQITIGEDAGKPFLLRDWQKAFIRDVYDPIHPNGTRKVRKAVLSMARKNGKTELAAALLIVHLIGPEAELNGEIYSAANDREQAAIVFNAVKRMVQASKTLSKYLKVVDSTKTVFVKASGIKAQGSRYRALSAEAGTKHGLNPSMVIYDELAQSKSRELLDTLLTSQGARAEPLFLTISTQSHDPQHPLSEMIDDGLKGDDETVVCHLYAAAEGCALDDEKAWSDANPALGDFRSLPELVQMASQAERMPSFERNFRLLYLNQRVNAHASLIHTQDWRNCGPSEDDVGKALLRCAYTTDEGQFRPGEPIYLALDMSMRTDLTALVAISATDGSRVAAWFWKPAGAVVEHAQRDRVPYEVWQQRDLLITPDGRTINPASVAAKIVELYGQFEVRGLAYDRYKIDELLRCFDELGFEAQEGEGYGLRLVPWGQGYKDMTPAVDALEQAVLDGDLKHDGHPILTWNLMNAICIGDAAGNRKLDKEKSRFRIDGAVSLAMALGLKARDRLEPVATSPWEDPAYSILPAK